MTLKFYLITFLFCFTLNSQQIGLLKYGGGGDWYANPTALPNLIRYCNNNTGTSISEQPITISANSKEIFEFPFLHMTGHGNVLFSAAEAQNLRNYLLGGGFLHIDDNYGMAPFLEKELPKIFPDKTLIEIGADHAIFKEPYNFPNGLPKIHEHDGQRPQALGYFDSGRLILLFTFESDLGDGWEDPEVHNDPDQIRQKALQMGANILNYAFKN